MIEYLLLALALFYVFEVLLVARTIRLPETHAHPHHTPTLSVVVAARNEESNIKGCISSLAQLDYPRDKIEILIVDDHSTDRTSEIAEGCAGDGIPVRLLRAPDPKGPLRGKPNALNEGIQNARGEVILMTDADCLVRPTWATAMAAPYHDPGVGLVAGFTDLGNGGAFASIQTLDWFMLFGIASGALSLGLPLTAVGTNLSVRKSAYDSVGGFPGIPFSITEDYALFRAITSSGWKATFPVDPRSLVNSGSCDTWTQLLRQKKRWFMGGRGMQKHILLLFLPNYLLHCFLVAGWFFNPAATAFALIAKLFADACLAWRLTSLFNRTRILRHFPAFEAYYILYVLVFPVVVLLSRRVRWKERSLPGA